VKNSPAIAPARSTSAINLRRLYLADAYCVRELDVKNAVAVELHMQPFPAMHSNPDEAMKVRRASLGMSL
jgi:hypothetical protein